MAQLRMPDRSKEDASRSNPTTLHDTKSNRSPPFVTVLKNLRFRFYFTANGLSIFGAVLKETALPWLILLRTDSPMMLGILAAANSLPMLLLSLPAGTLADRFNKRHILATVYGTLTLLGLFLFLVTDENIIIWHLILLSTLIGAGRAFEIPTRNAFAIDLVGRSELMSAIALNSLLFTAMRIVGPITAGLVIKWLGDPRGISLCFLLGSLCWLFAMFNALRIRLPAMPSNSGPSNILKGLYESMRHIRDNRVISSVLLLLTVTALFGGSYFVLIPEFAKNILNVGPEGQGLMMAVTGAGAMVGAVTVGSLGRKFAKSWLLAAGVFGITSTILIVPIVVTLRLSALLPVLFIAGISFQWIVVTGQSTIQEYSPDNLRGRMMGFYALTLGGLGPAGSLIMGKLAEDLGAPTAVRVASFTVVFTMILLFSLVPTLRRIN